MLVKFLEGRSGRGGKNEFMPPGKREKLKPEEIAPLAITGMQPVGQYAYSIEFSDGHSSGIYTLEYLRDLG